MTHVSTDDLRAFSGYTVDGVSNELILLELMQEQTSVGMSQERFDARMGAFYNDQQTEQGKRKLAGFEDTRPGQILMKTVLPSFIDVVEAWIDKALAGGVTAHANLAARISRLGPDVVAATTTKIIVGAALGESGYTEVASKIGRELLEEMHLAAWAKEQPKLVKWFMTEGLKDCTSQVHRSKILARTAKLTAGVERDVWKKTEKVTLGSALLDMFEATTGLIETPLIVVSHYGTAQKERKVFPSAAFLEILKDYRDMADILEPIYRPMLVPPKHWTNLEDGGYIMQGTRLMLTHSKGYADEAEGYDFSTLYKAVNALQDTAWQVNVQVLDIMEAMYAAGQTGAKLVSQFDKPLPPRLGEDATDEDWKAWKAEVAPIKHENRLRKRKRVSLAAELLLARGYADYPELYFVYYADWRGRLYPRTNYLQPQGDDRAKAMLRFAKGLPLGEGGADWLMFHMSGLCGQDKMPFNERVEWTKAQKAWIIESAEHPLDCEWWKVQKKPWQCLACCFELAGYWREGASFVSHLPISQDATCSGIQNFSAMIRDEKGGARVNLTPLATPGDIYADVAAELSITLKEIASEGGEHAEHAALWLSIMSRSVVKRNVMTLPYGATTSGFVEQLMDTLRKMEEDHELPAHFPAKRDRWKMCSFLAPLVTQAIRRVVVGAVEVMGVLQQWAKVAASEALPVSWVTPAGVLIIQRYPKCDVKILQLRASGKRIKISVREEVDSNELDPRRMGLAIAPNFVHSCDAAFLQLTISDMADQGVDAYAMIHDSFGTHACNSALLAATLRNVFVKMYSEHDVLQEFRDAIARNLFDPNLVATLADIPAKGTLDLDLVRESEFFFC